MLSKKMEKALNGHINAEVYSSYLYLSMAAYFESIDMPGAAAWMKKQAGEEWGHAMKMFEYVVERDGRVQLQKVDAPQEDWESPLAAFEDAYKHEQLISKKINELVNDAIVEKDHATNNMLQWFVSEQVEEEAAVKIIVSKLKMIGDSTGPLFMLDRELGSRG